MANISVLASLAYSHSLMIFSHVSKYWLSSSSSFRSEMCNGLEFFLRFDLADLADLTYLRGTKILRFGERSRLLALDDLVVKMTFSFCLISCSMCLGTSMVNKCGFIHRVSSTLGSACARLMLLSSLIAILRCVTDDRPRLCHVSRFSSDRLVFSTPNSCCTPLSPSWLCRMSTLRMYVSNVSTRASSVAT